MHRSLLNLLVIGLLLTVTAAAAAPAEDGKTSTEKPSTPSVEQRQRDVATALKELDTAQSAAAPEAAADLQVQRDRLHAIGILLDLQRAAASDGEELLRQLDAVTADVERQRATGLPDEPPYALAELDAALDLRDQYQTRLQAIAVDIKESETAQERAAQVLEEAQRARRRAREALDANSSPGTAVTLSRELRLRQLDEQFAFEQLELRRLERSAARTSGETTRKQLQLVDERIALIEPAATFSADELRNELQRIDEHRVAIETDLALIDDLRLKIERDSRIGKQETAEALAQLRQARSVLGRRLQRNAEFSPIFTHRHELRTGNARRADMRQWLTQATEASNALAQERIRSATRLAELQSLPAPETPVAKRVLETLLRAQQSEIEANDSLRRQYDRLADELAPRLAGVDLSARLNDLGIAAGNLWRYEIIAVEDRPITVATAVTAIAVLVFGVILSRRLSRLLGMRLLKRLGLEEGTAAAYQTLVFYFLVSLFVLFSLRALNVPLTLFTVAGGALAIGVGFGSQNILNNFISGLILLAERPIRLGDMVDVDGTYGAVSHIGLRSTRVRSFNNVDIIVPNSTFLEKNVVNWTLSDDRIRVNVNVGVMYGSDTTAVGDLIRQAVNAHPRVLNDPPPIVLFGDFGNDALMFEVHFWIRMRKLMDRRIVESDIRHEIDKLFREAAIVIAYPQRDVHLDTMQPLDVRLVASEGSSKPPG